LGEVKRKAVKHASAGETPAGHRNKFREYRRIFHEEANHIQKWASGTTPPEPAQNACIG